VQTFLRAFDPNLARRRLRGFLLEITREEGGDPRRLPHTFETNALLAAGQRMVRRPSVRARPDRSDLIEVLGIALAVSGEEEAASELFETALRGAADDPEAARFRYLLAHYIHFRGGELAEARRLLGEAMGEVETQRAQKSRILLVAGRVARQLGDLDAAERWYTHVLESGVHRFRPLAQLYLAILWQGQRRLDEAIALNRRAHAAMRRGGEELGMLMADSDLAAFHLQGGDVLEARRLLRDVVRNHVDLLDLTAAGNASNNLAMVCERLGDREGARAAYIESLRYHRVGGRKHLLAHTYRNLGGVLADLGEIEPALAAFDRAIELSTQIASPETEVRGRTEALEVLVRLQARPGAIADMVSRCDQILASAGPGFATDSVHRYARVLGKVIDAGLGGGRRTRTSSSRLATAAGVRALEKLTGGLDGNEFERLLRERIGGGLSGKDAPETDELVAFLLLFAGDYFRFRDFANEFHLTTGRVKHHLKVLVERNVIELTGTKKAAKYSLSFHRQPVP
jgi:tetratricopeptide (TPR) repeat protein